MLLGDGREVLILEAWRLDGALMQSGGSEKTNWSMRLRRTKAYFASGANRR